jgi:UDP-N-acetyl-D-glucosamine dehydrogenase
LLDKQLLDKINRKRALVGILGMGYVGLPLARTFWGAGFRTLGYDIDPKKVRMLNAGQIFCT